MNGIHEDYLRSALFGLQDGLVSTTGVVVGISTGVDSKAIIILAAFVAVTVEATSMAAGQYSSEKAVHQLDTSGKHTDSLVLGATIMFVAYFLSGLIPIMPFILANPTTGRIWSIIFAFLGLFAVGYIKGKLVRVSPLRSAVELFVIGAIATCIGLIVGQILKI
ncbi:MAG: VIT1/CCC1 transporter family protein [bacterium]|nr:VIT1/CCC1 transporter family protein [bacterium]